MVDLEIGGLYSSPEYIFFIYPNLDIAKRSVMFCRHVNSPNDVAMWAKEWSRYYKCDVKFTMVSNFFIILEKYCDNKKTHLRVLFGEKVGWITIEDWMRDKRIRHWSK